MEGNNYVRRKKEGRIKVAREAETPRGRKDVWTGESGTGQSEDAFGGQNLANHRMLFRCSDSDQSEHRIQVED